MHSLLWKQSHCINVYWDTIFLNSKNLYGWFGYTCLLWIHNADAVTFTGLLFVSTELHRIVAYARTPMPAYYALPFPLFKFFLAFFLMRANIVVIATKHTEYSCQIPFITLHHKKRSHCDVLQFNSTNIVTPDQFIKGFLVVIISVKVCL